MLISMYFLSGVMETPHGSCKNIHKLAAAVPGGGGDDLPYRDGHGRKRQVVRVGND